MKRRFSIVVASLFVFLISMTSVVFAWQPYINGRPSEFRPGYSRGYFIWRDDSGFNLRTASHRRGHVFNGVIRTNGDLAEIRVLRTEGGDRLRVDRERDVIRFRFRTGPGDVDGVDFRVRGGNMVHFELFMDGAPAHPQSINIGAYNRNPRDNSFRIMRERR